MEFERILSKKNLLTFFDYFAVFILIFYAGKATVFVQAIDSWNHPIGLFLPLATFGILFFIKKVRFNSRFWLMVTGFTLYIIASTIKFGELHPRFFLINIIYIVIVYIAVAAFQYRFLVLYENILYYLSIIGIVLWVGINASPAVIDFLRNFEFSTQEIRPGNIDYNLIVFTVNDYTFIPQYILNFGGVQLYRNAGFAWEPGAFSVYVSIAILFHLIRNKFKITNNRHLWVFILALATTFSTTGYSLLVLLIIFYIYNQEIYKIAWLGPVFVIIVMYLFTLPFMAEKISETTEFNTEELIYYSTKYNIKYQPQRFESLQIDFKDFLNHPIIGYGGHIEARWTSQLGANIATVSGLGKIMAQYGIVGLFFFIFSLWKSSQRMLSFYNLRGVIFPMAFILLISISYSIISPLLMCLWLFYLPDFYKTEVARQYLLSEYFKSKRRLAENKSI